MHLRIVGYLSDVKNTDGTQISVATQDGKKRSSAQRSRDIMDGRYYLMSVLRIVDKQIFYGIKADAQFDAEGYLNITAYNIINHGDIFINETTSAYGKTVPVKDGSELPIYAEFLRTFKTKELVAAVVSDNTSATRLTRLRLYRGANIPTALDAFKFDIGFFGLPVLAELVAGGTGDIAEPRIWWPIIEFYATYLGWLGSGNTKRALSVLQQVDKLTMMIVQNEYGTEAAKRVSQMSQSRGHDTVND
jgi:hypothetical protein